MTFPKENLIRMSNTVSVESSEDGMRTLTGVPIVFNEWTEINGWEGRFRERIAPDALNRTLAERGDKVKVLFNHGFDPQIGEKPLGKPTRMDVRDDGLHVEVPLADTSYNRDLQALVDAGALDGMSFRFGVVAEEWDGLEDDVPERTITELRLYEFGPVTFPAYEATTVGVRSRDEYDTFASRREYLDHVLTDPKPSTAPAGVKADEPPTQSRDLSSEKIAALRRIDMYLKGVSA